MEFGEMSESSLMEFGVEGDSESHPGTVGKLRLTAFQRCPDEFLSRLLHRVMDVSSSRWP